MMIIPLILIVILSVLSVFFTNSNQTMVEVIAFGHTIKSTTGFLLVGTLGRDWRITGHIEYAALRLEAQF